MQPATTTAAAEAEATTRWNLVTWPTS